MCRNFYPEYHKLRVKAGSRSGAVYQEIWRLEGYRQSMMTVGERKLEGLIQDIDIRSIANTK